MRPCALLVLSALGCQAAANMVIASNTINANGQFVVTLSPCSSPLTPASGVTGLTAYTELADVYTIASATTSGCTLTITVQANATTTYPVFSDQGNQFLTISAASNLTDNAGNTISATGNTVIATSANNSTWLEAQGSVGITKIRAHGSPKVITPRSGVQWISSDGCLAFTSTWAGSTGSFNILSFNYTSGFKIFEDGVQIGSQYTTTADTGYSVYNSPGSLSGAHSYEVCENLTGNGYFVLYGLQLVNGTYGARPALKKLMFVFGASEVDCAGISDTTSCTWWIIARALGYSDQHFGHSGWPVTVNTFGGITYPTTNLRDCALNPAGLCTSSWANFNFSAPPDMVLAIPGCNDCLVGTLIGPDYTTAGYFKGDSVTLFGNLDTTLTPPGHTIHVFDEYYVLATGGTCPGSTTQTPYETAWQGAGAAYLALHPTYKVSSHATLSATCAFGAGDFQAGNLHLNATGQAKWAAVMLPYLYGYVANPAVILP